MIEGRLPSSFRDPSGFVFVHNQTIYRQVNRVCEKDWRQFRDSGLSDELVGEKLILSYQVVSPDHALTSEAVEVIQPERVSLISYPYEWCFSQLKEAALLTLEIMRRSLAKGMCLKDASAYNVQFHGGAAIPVDTLSFEAYREGEPWQAYGQFCRHFLAPLALASLVDVRLLRDLRPHLDGLPLDLAAKLLPKNSKWNFGLLTHLHAHGKATRSGASGGASKGSIPKTALLGIIDSLEGTIRKLIWDPGKTTWGDYYDNTNYSDQAFLAKGKLVGEFVDSISPRPTTAWDLGANTGHFSEILAGRGLSVFAWDSEYEAVERAYAKWRKEGQTALVPLVQDFANPSPALGWAHRERESFAERGPVDVVLALALIHHLAIGNNVPLTQFAAWLSQLGTWAIVEFVAKDDSQVQRMLATRKDVFEGYTREGFEAAVADFFSVARREEIPGTSRTLYLLQARSA
ncbi:MAG: class I SAM-dependent methyltransferase [Armatimonadetes bacterium]|nr:class I SAM-dependent methyltransferase [Armatimonadota bacterium]